MALSESEARKLTEEIKRTSKPIYELFLEAYEGKAWKVLGYNNFHSWADREFGMDKRYAYRTLDQAKIIATLSNSKGTEREWPIGHYKDAGISENQARELKPLLKEPKKMREVYKEAKRRTNDKPTAKVIKEVREEFKKPEFDLDAFMLSRLGPDPEMDHNADAIKYDGALKGLVTRVVSLRREYDKHRFSNDEKGQYLKVLKDALKEIELFRIEIESSLFMDEKIEEFFNNE